MLRSDIVFHDIVVDISRGDIDLSLPEWALYRRTMTDLYNPRGPLWALCGFTIWRRMFPRAIFSQLFIGLYSWEASWAFHEKYPVATFFRDISLLDPQENKLAAKIRDEFPRIDNNFVGDRRGVMHRVNDFLRLKRTRLMFFGSKTAAQLHRATGVGTITVDFGPKPQKSSDIAFILGSHTSIGQKGYPVLRGIGPNRKKKGAVQPTIQDFTNWSNPPGESKSQSKKNNNNKNDNNSNNSGGNNNKKNSSIPPMGSSSDPTVSDCPEDAQLTGTIGGCAEIAAPLPPAAASSSGNNQTSSGDSSSSNQPTTTTDPRYPWSDPAEKFKTSLKKRREAILKRLRGAPSAKSATTDAERQKNCIRDVPLKTVWAYTASDDFIGNSDWILGGMWFLIQLSGAWEVGMTIGDGS